MDIQLYKKFNVARADGKDERSNAAYFVLDVANDKHARYALRAYGESVGGELQAAIEDLLTGQLILGVLRMTEAEQELALADPEADFLDPDESDDDNITHPTAERAE